MVFGSLAAALAGLFLFRRPVRRKRMSQEDRPPIIVKGGSVRFLGDDEWRGKQIKWNRPNPNRREWKPLHPMGKPANRFRVRIFRGDAVCGPYYGSPVLIGYRTHAAVDITFTVEPRNSTGKPEPMVLAPESAGQAHLENDTDGCKVPVLSFRDISGQLQELKVGGSSQTLQQGDIISITPLP